VVGFLIAKLGKVYCRVCSEVAHRVRTDAKPHDGRSVCVVRYGTAAGVLGVVWFVLWMVCASESPTQHGRINTAERQYIVDTLMTEAVAYHQVSDHHLQQQQQQQGKGGRLLFEVVYA